MKCGDIRRPPRQARERWSMNPYASVGPAEGVKAQICADRDRRRPNHGAGDTGIANVISSNEVFPLGALPKRIVRHGAAISRGLPDLCRFGPDVTMSYPRAANTPARLSTRKSAPMRAARWRRKHHIMDRCTCHKVERTASEFTTHCVHGPASLRTRCLCAIGRHRNVANSASRKPASHTSIRQLRDCGDHFSQISDAEHNAIGRRPPESTGRRSRSRGTPLHDTVFGKRRFRSDHAEHSDRGVFAARGRTVG